MTAPEAKFRRGPTDAEEVRRAFSLLELLCVVAILMILTVLVTNHGAASTSKKERIGCQANLEKASIALNLFQTDNKGAFPYLDTATNAEGVLSQLVPQDTTETAIFICPGSADKPLAEAKGFAGETISYAYYMGLSNDNPGYVILTDRQVNNNSKTAGQPLFSTTGQPPGNNHGKIGGNLLLLNGSVQFSMPASDRDLLLSGKLRLLNP